MRRPACFWVRVWGAWVRGGRGAGKPTTPPDAQTQKFHQHPRRRHLQQQQLPLEVEIDIRDTGVDDADDDVDDPEAGGGGWPSSLSPSPTRGGPGGGIGPRSARSYQSYNGGHHAARRSSFGSLNTGDGGSCHGSPLASNDDLRRLASSSMISEVGVEQHFASLAEAVGREGCRPTSRTTVVLRDVNYKVGTHIYRLSNIYWFQK